MKKVFLMVFGIGLIIPLILSFLAYVSILKYNKVETKMKINIGKRIVIENDTLLVADYSIFEGNYTLSNGSKASFELIEKLPAVK